MALSPLDSFWDQRAWKKISFQINFTYEWGFGQLHFSKLLGSAKILWHDKYKCQWKNLRAKMSGVFKFEGYNCIYFIL